jgi:hypothetical protein
MGPLLRGRGGVVGLGVIGLIGLVFGAGCPDIERRPNSGPFDAGPEDATPRDSGPADSGADAGPPSCLLGTLSCPSGTECTRNDRCRVATATCATTQECATPAACVAGACALPPGGCRSPGDCGPSEHCTPAGVCVPRWLEDGTLLAACQADGDCGPGGLCRGNACVPCSATVPCAGALFCASGRCIEASPCTSQDGCFAGNSCMSSRCVRSSSGCMSEGGVKALPEALLRGAICGDAPDHYLVSLAADQGARIVVRSSTPSLATFTASVAGLPTSSTSSGAASWGRYTSASVTILELAAREVDQRLDLAIDSRDASGSYSVTLEQVPMLCAHDRFQIYGASDPATAPVIGLDFSEPLRACLDSPAYLRFRVHSDDAIAVRASVAAPLAVDVGIGGGPANPVPLPTVRFTATSSARTSLRAPDDRTWTASLAAAIAPSAGLPYQLELMRRSGALLRSCVTPDVELSGDASQVLDFGAASVLLSTPCARWVDPHAAQRLVRVRPPVGLVPGGRFRATVTPPLGAAAGVASLVGCTSSAAAPAASTCDRSPAAGEGAAIELMILSSTSAIDLLVAGVSGTRLDVSFDASDNYSCYGGLSEPLVMSGETPVDTVAATDTLELTQSCGALPAGSGLGPDRFFALTLSAGGRAGIELTGADGGMLWAGTGCSELSSTCVGAAAIARHSPARLVLTASSATNFTIAVDGLGADTAGTWLLHTYLDPECTSDADCIANACDTETFACSDPPLNDACPGTPIPLQNGVGTVVGSTSVAGDDFASGDCPAPTVNLGQGGPDVVYALDVPPGLAWLKATITDANFDPVLSIRKNVCASVTSQVACDHDPNFNSLPDITLQTPSAGSYYFIVDSVSGRGSFTLRIETR